MDPEPALGDGLVAGPDSVVQGEPVTSDEPEDRPSRPVVEQRIRNRLIEYFDWVSSFEEQRRLQEEVPAVSVAGEVCNQWGDWVREPVTADSFGPVYSPDEVEAMLAYESVMARAIDETTDVWDPLESFQALPIWEELRRAAAEALTVFLRRGTLPEDHEV